MTLMGTARSWGPDGAGWLEGEDGVGVWSRGSAHPTLFPSGSRADWVQPPQHPSHAWIHSIATQFGHPQQPTQVREKY